MISVKSIERDDSEAALVGDWLSKDELHTTNGITLDDVFDDGTEAAMISDEQGPLIAVRFHKSLRVAMQFRPESRLRVARVGAEVTEWLKKVAKDEKCKEVIIRPGGKADKFSAKLGFREFIGRYLGV